MAQNIAEGYVQLSDERVTSQSFERGPVRKIKFTKKDETLRVHFMSEDTLYRRRHSNPLDKRYYRCLASQGYCPVCVEASKPNSKLAKSKAADVFAVNVLVYDYEGGKLKKPLNAEVYFWTLGADKFSQLRSIIGEWGSLTGLDLLIQCLDPNFQKVSIQVASKCLYNEADESFRLKCQEKFETDKYPLEKFVCKDLTPVDLAEVFGISSNSVPEEVREQLDDTRVQDLASRSPSSASSEASSPKSYNRSTSPDPEEDVRESSVDDLFADLDSISGIL